MMLLPFPRIGCLWTGQSEHFDFDLNALTIKTASQTSVNVGIGTDSPATKLHVKNNGDGTGEVRAKAWAKGEDEPAEWTIKVPVKKLHPHGAPGIYAFSPQAQKRVYIDNIKISAAE